MVKKEALGKAHKKVNEILCDIADEIGYIESNANITRWNDAKQKLEDTITELIYSITTKNV